MTLVKVLQILAGRWLLIAATVAITVVSAMVAVSMQPRIYASATKIIIDFKEPTALSAILPAHLQEDYMATQLGIMSSRHVMGRAIDILGYADDPAVIKQFEEETGGEGLIRDWLIAQYAGGVRVVTEDNSRLLTVRYRAEDPQIAADFANAVTDAYVDTVLQLNVQPAQKSAEWIDRQLSELRTKLENAQSALSAYQQEKGIVATDQRLDVEMSHLSTLTDQLLTAQSEVESLESRLSQVDGIGVANAASLETLPEVLGSSYIQSLKVDLRRKETELAQISSQVGSGHPQYQRTVAELSALRSKLAEEIRRIVAGMKNQLTLARQRVTALQKAQNEQKAKLLTLKQTTDDLPIYLREVENAQKNYDEALQRFQQYTLQSRVNQTNVTILSRARVPTEPVPARKREKLALAMLFGLILGIGFALLLETKDRLIRGREDVIDAVRVPLLGTVYKA